MFRAILNGKSHISFSDKEKNYPQEDKKRAEQILAELKIVSTTPGKNYIYICIYIYIYIYGHIFYTIIYNCI